MKETTSKHSISSLAPFILFVILTTCLLSVLLSGADLYRTINQRDQLSYDHRTLVQYLTTKIHQNDVSDQINIGDFDVVSDSNQGTTLHIFEVIEDRTFCTRIYCYNGYLYELFSAGGLDFSMSDGQPLLPLKDLSFSRLSNLLQIDVQYADEHSETFYIDLRSREEVAYEK